MRGEGVSGCGGARSVAGRCCIPGVAMAAAPGRAPASPGAGAAGSTCSFPTLRGVIARSAE